MLPEFTYIRPDTIEDALEHLRQPGARIHAGGTDVLGCLRDGVFEAERVVSLSGLTDLKGITETSDGGVAIGALTTIAEIAASELIQTRYAVLSQAAGAVGSPQLRNQGTIGGNICQRPRCWYFRGEFDCRKKSGPRCYARRGENRYHAILGGGPCYIVHPSDTAPALMALGASVRIAGSTGNRVVPIDEFFVLPSEDVSKENILASDEIVTEILVPPARSGIASTYRKVRERGAWDFALTSVALVLITRKVGTIEEATIVLGGVAPIPWRAEEAGAYLAGKTIDAETARESARLAVETAEPLAQNSFKIQLVRGVVESVLLGMT